MRLIGLLKERGLESVDFENHFPILRGRPRKPDAAFIHNGTNLISAKLGGREKETEALSTAQSYQTLVGESTALNDVFAAVYPRKPSDGYRLWVLANRKHDIDNWREETLEGLANRIVKVVNGVYIDREPKTASAKRVLSLAVREISGALTGVSKDRLKAVFGGKGFFDSVLAYQLPSEEEEGALRSAAGYLLVNQILFYEVLSRRLPGRYDPIPVAEPLDPADLWPRYFAKVLKKDYRPIFEVDVSSCLSGSDAVDGLFKVVSAVHALVPGLEQKEIMGDVFHELIPLTFRKPLGAYFTTRGGAELLARLAVDKSDWKVLDPACGSGTLLVAAYRQKRELYNGPASDTDLHRRFIEHDLVGIDVMAFVAHLAAVHLAIQEPLEDTDRVQIGVEDSTKKQPGDVLQATSRALREGFRQRHLSAAEDGGLTPVPTGKQAYADLGTVTVGGEQAEPVRLTEVDLVITNPPFTSCNQMSKSYRREVEQTFGGPTLYRRAVEGRWSFQVPFLLLADRFLKSGGRVAAVLPISTFSGKYFEPWVDMVLSKYTVRYIVAGVHGCAFSDDTRLTEVLFVADKSPPPTDHKFRLVGLRRGPHLWSTNDLQHIRALASHLRGDTIPAPGELAEVRLIEQQELSYRRQRLPKLVADLSRGFKQASGSLGTLLADTQAFGPTKDVLKRNRWEIYIGKAFRVFKDAPAETGHGLEAYGGAAIMASSSVDRALKSHDRLVIAGNTQGKVVLEDRRKPGSTFTLPTKEVIGYLRRFSGIDKLDATSIVDMTVHRYSPSLDPILRHFYGEEAGAKARTLKRDWKEKVQADQSRLLIAYKGRIVAPGTCLLATRSKNSVFVAGDVYGVRGTKPVEEEALVLWFNSTPFLLSVLGNRTVTQGPYGRLDKGVLNRLPMLDPRKLGKDDLRRLSVVYRRLSRVQWPSILTQFQTGFPPREKLDRAILSVLRVKPREQKALLEQMTRAVAAHLEGLAAYAKSEAAAI